MTTDSQNPASEIDNPAVAGAGEPAGTATGLALNEFTDAMGDGPMTDGQGAMPPGNPAQSEQDLSNSGPEGLEALYDIPVNITVVLGRTSIEVTDLLALGKGDVVELDRKVGEAIDIFVNKRLVARGEVVLVEERLGITMTEIIKGGPTG